MFGCLQKSTSIYFLLFSLLPGNRKGIVIVTGGTQVKYLSDDLRGAFVKNPGCNIMLREIFGNSRAFFEIETVQDQDRPHPMEDRETGAANAGLIIPVKKDVPGRSRALSGFSQTMPGKLHLIFTGHG